jgi:HK97 family phage major capsid protein
MNRYELKRKSVEEAMREHVGVIQEAYADPKRELTDEERLDVETHVKALEVLKDEKRELEENIKTLQHVDDIGRQLGPAVSVVSEAQDPDRLFQRLGSVGAQMKSLGEQFVDSGGYKDAVKMYREGGRLPSGFTTGMVGMETKGTLGEAVGAGGQALVSIPQLVPGAVETLFQPLTLADLLLSGAASAPTVRYIVEGTATNAATGVAEAGTKPESTLGLTTTDEPIKKIATVLPVSEEMLEDGPAIQSYINGRLTLFVRISEEQQLFRGAAGGATVQGLLTSRNVPIYTGSTAVTKAEQLFLALNSMRGSAFIEPEWVVMHPTDWQIIRLLKDTASQYLGGGPFLGPYGGPQGPVPAAGQISGPQDTIWGKPVYITANIGGAGTALVGTRPNAQVWRRGGLSVEATNSHSNYFALNLVAIRAEERLGLAVYRPSGYVETRFAVGPGG